MINAEVLRQIGLTNSEIEIYSILLRLQEATASDAARQAQIARPNVYDILNKLVEKGFVTYAIKNGKKYFRIVDPEKILDYLKEKEENFRATLPELKAFYKPIEEKLGIEIYEGPEGIKAILRDIIKTKKEIVAFGASDRLRQYLPEFIVKKYVNDRERYNIKARQLCTAGEAVLETKTSKFRPLPKEFSSPSTTAVYGDKVSIWIWAKTPTIVLIDNPSVAKSYRQQFELMWQAANKLKLTS